MRGVVSVRQHKYAVTKPLHQRQDLTQGQF